MTSKLLINSSTLCFIRKIHCAILSQCSHNLPELAITKEVGEKISSPLDICNEDVSNYAPFLAPTFNLAAYANKSPTIQQFIKLGVDLNRVEKKGFTELILRCDFSKDVEKYLKFLYDVGVPPEEFGHFITVNPAVLKEDLNDLSVRINYLESKNFQHDQIVRILVKNPKWISHQIEDIDDRLGFFQDYFKLTSDEVRHVAVRKPNIVTFSLRHVEKNKFTIKEEMGFSLTESKQLLLQKPKIYMLNRTLVQQRLGFLLNTMNIAHQQIVLQPGVILSRLDRTRTRHNFLVLLKRNQYDCHQPGYISLENLVRGSDVEFCENIAKVSVKTYNAYLKTL